MQVNGKNYHTIWVHPNENGIIQVIDQQLLPFSFRVLDLKTEADAFEAIKNMTVRGAPLIGVTGAYGIYLSLLNSDEVTWKSHLKQSAQLLKSARPTAVNLAILIDEMVEKLAGCPDKKSACETALLEANRMKAREIAWSEAIGDFGCELIEAVSKKKNGAPVNILTHCNAGWLACIDWGTATAPVYKAFHKNIPLHVWVDETRPRNQGARLTAWELSQEGVPHTVIPDNAGGHLMQHGMVDLCIVGSDRTTATGDVANKIGTYLKALAAFDNRIPFYVALPSSSIDFTMQDGIREIPIEQRDGEEVRWMEGVLENGFPGRVNIIPEGSPVANYGFDVTPARLVTALITERGICPATAEGIKSLFPDLIPITKSTASQDLRMNHPNPAEGSVKFICHLATGALQIPASLFEPLNHWRRELWLKQLIGSYPDGIGYGNISVRLPGSSQFYISGTSTGGIPELDQTHYALVEKCDPALNTLWCSGDIRASAESMSHFAVYEADAEIGAVVHIHNRALWEQYIDLLPTTDRAVEYGTPGMAAEISRIMKLPQTLDKKAFVMGGHEEGIISFGKTVAEAASVIFALLH